MQKHHALKQGTGADPVRSFGDPTYYPVRRMTMNQSAVQSGVQYYRDLAGNIKQVNDLMINFDGLRKKFCLLGL